MIVETVIAEATVVVAMVVVAMNAGLQNMLYFSEAHA